MRKSKYLLAFALIGTMLISGCVGGTTKQNVTANSVETPVETIGTAQQIVESEPIKIDTLNTNEASNEVFIEGKAMKNGTDYYIAVILINQGDKPVKIDFVEQYFFMGSFENRIGYLSFNYPKKKILMPGESSYFSFDSGGSLDSLKINTGNYKDNNAGFYLRMSKEIGTDGYDAYMTDLPPLESLPSKSDNLRDGYTLKFRRTMQKFGTEADSLYVEAVLFTPPNLSVVEPRTKEDRDYLITVKLVNNGKDNIVFDKVTTLIDDGGNGIWGNTPIENGKYWVLRPGEPLHLVFSTNSFTRRALQYAKENQKKELFFSFELSSEGRPIYKVFITPLAFMENLPDSEQILSIDGIPLKLLTFDNPKKIQ